MAHDRLWGAPFPQTLQSIFQKVSWFERIGKIAERAMVHCCALQSTFPSWFLLRKNTPKKQKKTFVRIVDLLHKAFSSQSDSR